MPRRYEPRRDLLFSCVFFAGPVIAWLALIFSPSIVLFIISILISAFFMWVWLNTGYAIDGHWFFYKSGPFRKKIPIDKIIGLKRNVRSWAGMRPALSFNHLQVRYNTYDDVFIAPQDEEAFIQDLLARNPDISVWS